MRTVNGIEIEGLDIKQRCQLINLCEEFQPYTNIEGIAFLEVVLAARQFCDIRNYQFYEYKKEGRFEKLLIQKLIKGIKDRYFFNGIKYSMRPLRAKQFQIFCNACNCPKVRVKNILGFYDRHDSTEKELFMKVVRACRDYMRAKMSKEAESDLFEKLCVVYDAIV